MLSPKNVLSSTCCVHNAIWKRFQQASEAIITEAMTIYISLFIIYVAILQSPAPHDLYVLSGDTELS